MEKYGTTDKCGKEKLASHEECPCPECKEGDVVIKRTKKRRIFYGCSRWPKCEYASWKNPKEEKGEEKEPEANT